MASKWVLAYLAGVALLLAVVLLVASLLSQHGGIANALPLMGSANSV